MHWLTSTAQLLAAADEQSPKGRPAQSVIMLWMQGGPSQLETFDPQPGTKIGGPTRSIATAAQGVRIAAGLEQVAEQMADVALIRSVVSKEGDHERGTYMVKSGYAPNPTAVHPSIGAICCHLLPDELSSGVTTEIPRHISILASRWPGRGGELGDQLDAFQSPDPLQKQPDVTPRVAASRFDQRLHDLEIVERAFSAGRRRQAGRTMHADTVARATRMMSSEQLQAFDIQRESLSVRQRYGDTPFGRACLAARRLTEVGVRCVEVTLNGWDTHIGNFEGCTQQLQLLDGPMAALIADLRERDQLRNTVVVWGGEFGRTPRINAADGRDHWPGGFSMALAGGGIRGGVVIGETDPEGDAKKLVDPHPVADVHATVLAALGIDFRQEYIARTQRSIKFCEGEPIAGLL